MKPDQIRNYTGGAWGESAGTEILDVPNPATDEVIARVRMTTAEEVDAAVRAANAAFQEWRDTPPVRRAQFLLKLREIMLARREDIARTLTTEHGKTLTEAGLEVDRAIDNIEVAAGAPSLMMGRLLEDVSKGIDEYCVRQPLGTFAVLCPFNFPAMIPFWFMPYALATGNTYVVKPSPRVPMTMQVIFDCLEKAGFPPGVVNCVNGGGDTANALIDHPGIVGVSFVGSTPVGRQVYARAASRGKRAQVQAGAKNFAIVMPDADMAKSAPNMIASAFDCSGQRCLALSCVITVGRAHDEVRDRLLQAAKAIRVGNGLEPGAAMGPVISRDAQKRIEGCIAKGEAEGAKLLLDGRGCKVAGYPNGYWVGPTIFDECRAEMSVAREEIFGPVLCVIPVDTYEEAKAVIAGNPYGNAASIFTRNGGIARDFRHTVRCGNLGINIGVAAPIAMFHFSGMKDSFFGDLHAQGRDAIQFFTEGVVVVERWF
ncbi:MAG TPA: CoA-acylating methylmalonate-semialdehyde dehydrogenase [Candidatus Brocadiia bacterium]|nr:CoA-acylating methylmalonate-semialdehyde dehydrogenase [Candidatus Brocadiia bacterium]